MGIICSRWQEQAGGAKKLLIADHDGNTLFNDLPAGMSGLESQITVDPDSEIAYVHDDSATGKVFAIDLSAGNVGDVLDTWTWTAEWGAIRVLFHQITDGKFLLGTNFGGDGKLYITNTAFDEEHSYQLSDNDLFIDMKITPDKQFLYLLNFTDKKIHKLAINQIQDFANQTAFEAACEWTVTLTESPRRFGLDTTDGDLIVATFNTNFLDVKTYRLSATDGSTVWSQDYGFNVPALDIANGFVYIANGADGGGDAQDADKLLYSDGTIADTEENAAVNPSRVQDAAIAHDQAICFFGGIGGNNVAKLWAVDIPAFTRQWVISSGVDPEIRFSGDPSGYHFQQMSDIGADEPNWADPSIVLSLTFPDGGESLLAGVSVIIFWTSAGFSDTIEIDLYKGGVLDSAIANAETDDGSFLWGIPSDQTVGADYRVRISRTSDLSVFDQSSSDFSIVSNPSNSGHNATAKSVHGTSAEKAESVHNVSRASAESVWNTSFARAEKGRS